MAMAVPRACCTWLLLPFFTLLHLSSAADTMSANSSLSGDQTITSAAGNFVLGFFKPGNATDRYYVGIWYAKVPKRTAVWVANREAPVKDPATSELVIAADGNLALVNPAKSVVWSTAANITSSNSTIAVILDSGNLQLRDASDSSRVFWQSFDHPTDTWLPGGKIGLKKVTKVNQRLTSWKNNDDPAPGLFSLEIDPNGTSQYIILWNSTNQYWTSGLWNQNTRIFNNVPEMTSNYIYDFEYVSNSTDNFFTYSVNNPEIISRFVMGVSGQIHQYTWVDGAQSWILFWSQPRQQCQVYSFCGSYGSCNEIGLPFCKCIQGFSPRSQTDWDLGDQSGGCIRNVQLQCGRSTSSNSDKDGFLALSSMRLPVRPQSLAGVRSDGECRLVCLNNCSCTAYSFGSTGCSVWYGEELLNLQEQYNGSDASTLQLRLAASELRSSKSKGKTVIWIAIGSAAAVLTCLGGIWFLIRRRRRMRRMMRKAKAVGGALVPFTYSELQHATNNFSHKLGGGGFGSVFKGSLPDSTAIAVKKLEGLQQGEKQFRTEVSTIGTVRHVNLVRLLGFCSEGASRLLVYEFMPRGSLDAQLFHGNSEAFDWETRYKIALGTARGLAYLHEQCRDCIIHCDIKPENILLDDSFVAKVADFGLAKLMGRDFSRVLTTMRGTRGYLAPEWITGVAITTKADVYSYGMMLFEIVSGRRNLEQTEEGCSSAGFFPTLVAGKLVGGDVASLLDSRLEGKADLEELERACKIACWCIQDDEGNRPTMGQVVQVLEGFVEVDMPPIPRSIRVLSDTSENINFFYEFSSKGSSQTRSATSNSSHTRSTTSLSSGV